MTQNVKYPFEADGRWVVRHHAPYDVEHEGRPYAIVASVFAEPLPHARLQVSCRGELVAQYDDLVPGATLEITGDTWRVAEVEYRKKIVLERTPEGRTEGKPAGEPVPGQDPEGEPGRESGRGSGRGSGREGAGNA